MDIQKLIKSVSQAEIKKVQQTVKKHYEGGCQGAQMNMIAFD